MAARQRLSRSKRRGEENKKRREKEPPLVPPSADDVPARLEQAKITAGLWAEITEALSRTRFLAEAPKLRDPRWWGAQLAAYGDKVDPAHEIADAEAYLVRTPAKRAQYRDLARFLGNSMARHAKEEALNG